MLFQLKSGWESNIKEVGDFLSFPTGIYLPSSDQRFRHYDSLQDDGVAENCISRQNAVGKEKYNLGLFRSDSSPKLNTKIVENSPRLPSITYSASFK
jgi:hypothetical protein